MNNNTKLTPAARRYLDDIEAAGGTKRYNGRALAVLERLQGAGLIDLDLGVRPSATGSHSWIATVTLTDAGRGYNKARAGLLGEVEIPLRTGCCGRQVAPAVIGKGQTVFKRKCTKCTLDCRVTVSVDPVVTTWERKRSRYGEADDAPDVWDVVS